MELGDRMKAYEETFRNVLPVRMPAVIRLDGKAFHTLTRGCERPYDEKIYQAMTGAARALLQEVPGRMAYQQSDEVSVLLIDYNKFDSQQWFGGIVQKMVSVVASVMGVEFSSLWGKPGYFDARVFVVPERDIENYFVWRQKDAMKNAISMAAQSVYSPKQLLGKHGGEMKEMLLEKGIKFDDYPAWFRMGSVIQREFVDPAPEFAKNRDVLQGFLKVEEE